MKYRFDFNKEKDELLKETRDIGFDDAIQAIADGRLVSNIPHPKYPNQWMFLLYIQEYIYVVPYVKNELTKVYFLKTIFTSRKYTKLFMKEKKK